MWYVAPAFKGGVSVATPLIRGMGRLSRMPVWKLQPGATVEPLILKSTVPVATPPPVAPTTVTLKVTIARVTDGLCDEVTVALTASLVTLWSREPSRGLVKLLSPL